MYLNNISVHTCNIQISKFKPQSTSKEILLIFFLLTQQVLFQRTKKRAREKSIVPETAWFACRLQIATPYTPLFHPARPFE